MWFMPSPVWQSHYVCSRGVRPSDRLFVCYQSSWRDIFCKQVNRFANKWTGFNANWTGFRSPSATVVSAEPFLHGTVTLRCLQKEMAIYRHWSVSLWRDPDNVSHCRILSPDKWMAAYLGYTVRMKMLFRGWPVVAHEMHTRRSGSANWHRWSTGQGHERSTFGVRRSVWVIQHQNRSQKNLFCEDLLRTVLGVVLTKSGSR